jgi:UDP-N-acetyl-D-glucosamine dehydrogenase
MTAKETLLGRISRREAKVGIVGLGYVGLPLAVEFAEAGFSVLGVDVSEAKVQQLNRGESYIADIPTERLKPLVESGK